MPARRVIAVFIAFTAGAQLVSAQAGRRGAAPAPPPQVATARPGMTNDDVLRMVQAGLGEAVVLATIRTATTHFDLSPDALIGLKKGGVSDVIVAVMIDPKSATPPPAPPTRSVSVIGSATPADTRARVDSATASPDIPREPGIYWDKGHDGAHDLVALEPTVFSQGKSGGWFTSALTYGIKKINWKAVTRGNAAVRHVNEPRPTFYFYFESKGSGLGNTGGFAGWLASATSPNEFVLARMTSKSRERELVVGEWGAFGGSSGTRSKDTVDIEIERLSAGIYRVTPAMPLEAGEYCFFYAGGVSTLGVGVGATSAGKLFDFGIYDASGR